MNLDSLGAVFHKYSAKEWAQAQREDLVLGRVRDLMSKHDGKPSLEFLKAEAPEVRHYSRDWELLSMEDGILCRKVPVGHATIGPDCIVQRLVPGKWRVEIFLQVHRSECRHLGYDRVHAFMYQRYFWYGMSQDLLGWLRACQACQQAKPGCGRGKMPLRQDLVGAPLMRVAMDLAGPMNVTQGGNKYILVVQDYFSKWIELFALPDKTAKTVASCLVREYFTRYGVCERLHSDQGLEFDNAIMKEICDLWGIKKTRTSPFAPWSNGMVERSNRTIKHMLKHMCCQRWRNDWDERLPFVRMTLNATVHSTTGFTPHKLFMSRCEDPVLPSNLMYGAPRPEQVSCLREYVLRQQLLAQEAAELARSTIGRAASTQRASKERAGLKIRPYKVGDWVWRWWPPAAQDKLHATPFMGPYEVLDVSPDCHDVKLRIPAMRGGLIDKWIHVSNLKPVIFTRDGKML